MVLSDIELFSGYYERARPKKKRGAVGFTGRCQEAQERLFFFFLRWIPDFFLVKLIFDWYFFKK